MLIPCFHRFPDEAALIGRMLAGWGEIELSFGLCAGHATGDLDSILNAMFRVRSEASRIGIADALGRPAFDRLRLLSAYTDAYGGARFCLRLRNQYAHCHWADHHEAGLFFTNLEEAAKSDGAFEYDWLHVDLPLLQKQEAYFVYVLRCMYFLEAEAKLKRGERRAHAFAMPRKQRPPNLCNPREKHIPPWRGSTREAPP